MSGPFFDFHNKESREQIPRDPGFYAFMALPSSLQAPFLFSQAPSSRPARPAPPVAGAAPPRVSCGLLVLHDTLCRSNTRLPPPSRSHHFTKTYPHRRRLNFVAASLIARSKSVVGTSRHRRRSWGTNVTASPRHRSCSHCNNYMDKLNHKMGGIFCTSLYSSAETDRSKDFL
jgi:hypothetical protein